MKKAAGLCLILVVIAILGLGDMPAWAADCGGATVCKCGDTVTTDYDFPANLVCGDNPGESVDGLIVAGGVHVNLKGFKLVGTGRQGFGLLLLGSGGSLQNGRIQNFTVGIGSTGFISDWEIGVKNPLSVTGNVFGLSLGASDTSIESTAADSNVFGIVVSGDGNTIRGITCSKNEVTGLLVQGDHNVLDTNRCERNGAAGIILIGNVNTLYRNLAQNNGDTGVTAMGNGNSFLRNQGRNNAINGILGTGVNLESDGRNYGTGNGVDNCHIDGHPTTGGSKYC